MLLGEVGHPGFEGADEALHSIGLTSSSVEGPEVLAECKSNDFRRLSIKPIDGYVERLAEIFRKSDGELPLHDFIMNDKVVHCNTAHSSAAQ